LKAALFLKSVFREGAVEAEEAVEAEGAVSLLRAMTDVYSFNS